MPKTVMLVVEGATSFDPNVADFVQGALEFMNASAENATVRVATPEDLDPRACAQRLGLGDDAEDAADTLEVVSSLYRRYGPYPQAAKVECFDAAAALMRGAKSEGTDG